MSIVILGGNECMERRYKDLCDSYQCQSKIFTKPSGGLRKKMGSPDLMIFFTSTMSHKMLHHANEQAKKKNIRIARCPSSSMAALKNVLDSHAAAEI